jgi:hypothetical protein
MDKIYGKYTARPVAADRPREGSRPSTSRIRGRDSDSGVAAAVVEPRRWRQRWWRRPMLKLEFGGWRGFIDGGCRGGREGGVAVDQ